MFRYSNFFVVCMFGVAGHPVCPVCPASVMVWWMGDVCLLCVGAYFVFMERTPIGFVWVFGHVSMGHRCCVCDVFVSPGEGSVLSMR